MKITIDLDPKNPSTPDILRRLADIVEGQRVPVEVPAPRPDLPWPPNVVPAMPTDPPSWFDRVRVSPTVGARPLWLVTPDHYMWC